MMEKPTLLNSKVFDYWIADCDIGSIGVGVCTGPQFKLLDHDGKIIWDKTLGGSTSTCFFSKYGSSIIVGCYDGAVRLFDFEGTLQKEIVFSYPVSSIAETPNSLIICVGQHVIALDKEWREQWRFKMPFYIKTCDSGREGDFIIGSQYGPEGGALVHLDADGNVIWHNEFPANVLVARYIEYINDENIIFGTRDGSWGILARTNGDKLHSARLKGSVLCCQKSSEGWLLGGRDKTLRSFHTSDDKIRERWKYKFHDVVYCCSLKNIEGVNVKLLVGTLDHQLYLFS